VENLDQYADSYTNSPYMDENAGMLDRYIAYILEAMEGFETIDALSLGIGYRVGSETIVKLLHPRRRIGSDHQQVREGMATACASRSGSFLFREFSA